jgi:hypothetical protein
VLSLCSSGKDLPLMQSSNCFFRVSVASLYSILYNSTVATDKEVYVDQPFVGTVKDQGRLKKIYHWKL